uniref:Unannotated protein n=1 Tax=freshwater metagenome TaxID=449393 RepID=A0A6J5ZZS3_9ZZZZ
MFVVEGRARLKNQPASVQVQSGRAVTKKQFNLLISVPIGGPEGNVVAAFLAGKQSL